jgi:FSR family fosmidomycin resistance protein-like MFS transporter
MNKLAAFVLVLLLIECLDELVFGAGETAWPLIRSDLALTYVQIGLLLSVPKIFGSLVEMPLGILADTWKRRILVLTGGVLFAAACYATALSHSFWPLLLATMLFHPSSGAFVSLSQATLMDSDPSRHDQNMARWTFAGSLGVVGGTLLLSASAGAGFGWRSVYVLFGTLALILMIAASRFRFPNGSGSHEEDEDESVGFREGVQNAIRALRRLDVIRWIVLLQMGDLLADILLSFLALYLVDVAHFTLAQAGLMIAIKTGIDIVGDAVIIPLLERIDGVRFLRITSVLEIGVFAAFLLVLGFIPKLILISLVSLLNSGWYAILTGRLYSSMPGQSGTVTTISNVFGIVGTIIPLSVGFIAEHYGMGIAMWLLILGPISLLIGLPRRK